MLTVEPLIPPMIWLTLALAAAVVGAWYAWRRPVAVARGRWAAMVTLMFVGVGLVLLVLLNPTLVRDVPPPAGKPVLTVLVDATASMATPDAPNGQTRYQAAVATAEAIAKGAGARLDVRVQTFADGLQPVSLADLPKRKPEGLLTDIPAAVLGAVEADRPQGQGLVLLTDGIQTAEGGTGALRSAARFAKAAGVPIYAQSFGGQGTGRDLAVAPRTPQELAFVGRPVALQAQVRARNYAGEVTVRLLRDGKEIASKKVQASDARPGLASFEVSDEKVGVYPFAVRVDPLPGEMTEANNAATMVLRVVDQPVRVLLLEGKPYWDSKFLIRLLALDPAVEMHSLVRMAPGRFMHRVLERQATASTAPTTAPETGPDRWKIIKGAGEVLGDAGALQQYQIILLGRDAEEFLNETTLANLQKWIARDGGSLVCFRGAPVAQVNQGLARLLPVRWAAAREARFRFHLTEAGKELNWFAGADESTFAALPALVSATNVQHTKPLTTVLATAGGGVGEEAPAITCQAYGTGRTVVLEGAGMWRWAFLPRSSGENDVYSALWRGMFRWLVSSTGLPPGHDAALRADKISFSVTEPATATVLTRPDVLGEKARQLTVELRKPDGKTVSVPCTPLGDDPGAYRVDFEKLPEGRYEAQLVGVPGRALLKTVFDVRQFGEEQLNLAARPEVLAMFAGESGGAVLGAADAAQISQIFQEHLRTSRPVRVIRTSAWDRWWALAGIVLVWAGCWALRRSSGLV